MAEDNGQSKKVEPDLEGRFRLDVGQLDNGSFVIDQTEIATKEKKRVAIFPKDEVVLTVQDEESGKHRFATRDMAEIRAVVFTRIFSELASSGQLGI